MDSVNVVCLKFGTKYGPEYVNKLHNMCKRHVTLPLRFICITEDAEGIDDGVEIFPLPEFEEPTAEYLPRCQCWRKLALFDAQYHDLKGKTLLIDLDVVIVDNIDDLFTFSDKLVMPENWSRPGRLFGQGSVICFNMGQFPELLDNWRKDAPAIYKRFDSEQNYIPETLGWDNIAWLPKEWVISFKDHCMPGGVLNSFIAPTKIPAGAKIITFHGNPNPPDAIAGRWGAPVPWYKSFYKTVKPTRWIDEYWR